jgi:type VI secretion system protein ImpE
MNAQHHYEAGNLPEAIAAATEEVRKHPADAGRRAFFCELLCFAGDLDRADKQLDALGQLAPDAMLGLALFRQLIRAEQARRQFYTEGRLPEFLDKPSPLLELHLKASIAIREGNSAEAATLLGQAEEMRPKPAGTCDGQPFDDFRDLDDLLAPVFEVLTTNGKYYWIPANQVELVELRPFQRPRDLLWRLAHMIVRGGPDGEVYLPTLYHGSHDDPDNALRLGRATDWRGGKAEPMRGVGQRTFLVGDAGRTILEMQQLVFKNA